MQKMNKKTVIILIVILSISDIFGQTVNYDWLNVQPITYVNQPPEDLTQEKSIAIVIAPTPEKGTLLAQKFHSTFMRSGVDPVSYYHVDDLFANNFISEKLTEKFAKREIKYLVIINHSSTTYEIVFATFSGTASFIDIDKPAWRLINEDFEAINRSLYSQTHSLERRNFLIADQPEFQAPSSTIVGQRFEAFKPDLKTETLYVKLFEPLAVDSALVYTQNTLLSIKNFNSRVEKQNLELKTILSNYPYPYEFIGDDFTNEELSQKNVKYVLESIHTNNGSIREVLKYKEKNIDVTEYISVTVNGEPNSIKRIGVNVPVYKYYIKHLPSTSFYLGTKWDSDITWQAALKNHIGLLRAEIE